MVNLIYFEYGQDNCEIFSRHYGTKNNKYIFKLLTLPERYPTTSGNVQAAVFSLKI